MEEEERLETNDQLELARKYVEQTNTNIFLTGKAGTGKTTFLKTLRKNTFKRMVVVAPTGVAAINAQGVTIHSFFQIGFGPFIESRQGDKAKSSFFKFSKQKRDIIRTLDLLVIDEISMVRADLLDAIDYTLRRFRKGSGHLPFGGVQLLMIGDLQQLPPVVKDEEWELLQYYYDTQYFFSSMALRKSSFVTINLQEVFRQKDEKFINILNDIRNNNITEKLITELNERSNVDYDPTYDEGYVILCTHNYQANKINENKLNQLDFDSFVFKAKIVGDFPENSYPNEFELELKRDAQVMFIKNDFGEMNQRKYYNGKIGKIVDIDEETITVRSPGDDEDIVVKKYVWNNYKYSLNQQTSEIIEESIGTFEQYPIKLAWAITIHKSQGLTFDKIIIDSNKAFASGQVYVALSRCRTLEGIILTSAFNPDSIIKDQKLIEFDQEQEDNPPTEEKLQEDSLVFLEQTLLDLFSFKDINNIIGEIGTLNTTHFYKIYSDTSNKINQLIDTVLKDIIEVSYKFEHQIIRLAKEGITENLIERLIKAIEYYVDKLKIVEEVYVLINQMAFDNKEIENLRESNADSLIYELYIKLSLFGIIDKDFSLKEFLVKKNKLLVQDQKKFIDHYQSKNNVPYARKKLSQVAEAEEGVDDDKAINTSSEIVNQELYDTIREWRYNKSKELEVPIFMVLTQVSLVQISNNLPKTEKELLQIKGIGKKKVEQFGGEILEMVAEYDKSNA
ncbi:MAG: AAA family ATPase [Bacteroidales bacterium]|nr:AAA family ATPase [Bacteroidales bacterium]MDD4684872.1 AAA family ATPase [Bacteroidales bacterium]